MSDLTTILAFCIPSVGFLILGYWMQQHYREAIRQHIADRKALVASIETYWQARYDMAIAARYDAEREASKYRTALRGELHRQARAELIRPDEPVGVASVLEFRATGRGGGRKS